jgi:hypothetical protein
MRGDASTKSRTARTALFRGLVVMATVGLTSSCDPGPFGGLNEDAARLASYKGHAAIAWSLNGAPLTTNICTTERITSMNVFVASKTSREDVVEFLNVSCELDKYSMAMIPSGSLRVFVDAMRESGGKEPCVRYSGQIDLTAGSSFPNQPTPVPLKFVANCP